MRRATALLASVSLIFLAVWWRAPARADDGNASATIAALQTKVAKLETRVAKQKTVIAALSPSAPTPSPTVSTAFHETPVAESNGVEVLYYYFLDDKFPEVLGELRNPTDTPIRVSLLAVDITLLDADGNIVDSVPCEVPDAVIPPHETVPFVGSWINTTNRPELGDWSTEQVAVNVIGSSTDYINPLVLSGIEEQSATASSLSISGWVENHGDSATGELVEVAAAGYDSNGRFVGLTWGQISTSIPAGKKARFSINSFGDYAFEGLTKSPNPADYTYRLFARDFENS